MGDCCLDWFLCIHGSLGGCLFACYFVLVLLLVVLWHAVRLLSACECFAVLGFVC